MSKILKTVLPSGTQVEASDKGYTIQMPKHLGGMQVDNFSSKSSDPYTNLQRGVLAVANISQENTP